MIDPPIDLELARRGDRDALERLLERNRELLERTAHARMHTPLRARLRTSDIVQSAYVEVVGSIADFRGSTEEAFVHWVVRIVENTARDAGRRFQAEKRAPTEGGAEGNDIDPPDAGPSPSSEVALGDELLLIGRALQRLPADYRRVLLLRLSARGRTRDAAKALNRSEGATRILLARARAALLVEMRKLRSAS